MAFFAGLDAGNRAAGSPCSFLPLREPLESLSVDSRLLRNADACAGSLVSDAWIQDILDRGLRCVNLGQWSRINSVTTVAPDYSEIGFLSAEALVTAGAEAVYVIAPPGQWRSRLLNSGAQQCIDELEHAQLYDGPSTDLLSMKRWIESLDPTVAAGALCINDAIARRLIELAESVGIEIGHQLKVVGVGDDPEASLLAPVPIASVPLPFHALGRAVIQSLIEDVPENPREVLLSPEPIVARQSLGQLQIRDPIVERALDFMARSVRRPMGISQLAADLGLSRRSLELKFQKSGLRAPAKEWMALRIAEAQRLLRETDWRLYEIAERTGFESQQRFAQAFRDAVGQSASAWRMQNTR